MTSRRAEAGLSPDEPFGALPLTGRPASTTAVRLVDYGAPGSPERGDRVATEEPLEIRLAAAAGTSVVAVTMRTPGADHELAAGFLYAEGVIGGRADVVASQHDVAPNEVQRHNVVTVRVAPTLDVDLRGLERHFFASSACGVCGKAGLEQLAIRGCAPLSGGPVVAAATLAALPDQLRAAQAVFQATGGLHAAALFTPAGELLAVREDVGRHNAVDKLVGWALLNDRLPLADAVVLVSGRSSFEIVQKCLMAGVPVLAAVSAPSSMAVQTAAAFGLTLVGFLRAGGFNVYTGAGRIAGWSDAGAQPHASDEPSARS